MKRALITGAAGQDGTYLTELLLSKGYEVWGVVGPEPGDYLAWAAEQGEHLHPCDGDLADAGFARPPGRRGRCRTSATTSRESRRSQLSWEHPALVADINATGVARLIDAIRKHAPEARLCQATSAEIFGNTDESPQTEKTPIRPITPYGSAKAYAHFLLENAREGWGMFACNAILYNHESPRRPPTFVTAQDRRGRRAHQARAAGRAAARQPRRRARLGFRWRLRRGHVADAAGRRGRRLHPRDGDDPHRSGVLRGGVRARGARLAGPRRRRPGVLPARRPPGARGRCEQGARAARVGAEDGASASWSR